MILLLDTCTFLWAVDRVDMLSPAAAAAIRDPANEVILHQVSALEIQLKHRLGKLPLLLPPRDFIPQALAKHGFGYRTLDDETIWNTAKLPDLHRDPFDRLLVAHALYEGLPIVTPDPMIQSYPARVIW